MKKKTKLVVTSGNVVSLAYTVSDETGKELDSTNETGILDYIQGSNHLLLGLQNALEGKSVGDSIKTNLAAKDAYGKHHAELVQPMEKGLFENTELKEGSQFEIMAQDGKRLATVITIDGNEVIVDLNHPLAGKNLIIESKIVDIRKATAQEMHNQEVR